MPPPSKVAKLPEGLRAALEERIRLAGFAGFSAHADWLKGIGYQVGKSAIQAYAQRHRDRIEHGAGADTLVTALEALRIADQRIECVKIAAALIPGGNVFGAAEKILAWAYGGSAPNLDWLGKNPVRASRAANRGLAVRQPRGARS